jgi:hypothetical protein
MLGQVISLECVQIDITAITHACDMIPNIKPVSIINLATIQFFQKAGRKTFPAIQFSYKAPIITTGKSKNFQLRLLSYLIEYVLRLHNRKSYIEMRPDPQRGFHVGRKILRRL